MFYFTGLIFKTHVFFPANLYICIYITLIQMKIMLVLFREFYNFVFNFRNRITNLARRLPFLKRSNTKCSPTCMMLPVHVFNVDDLFTFIISLRLMDVKIYVSRLLNTFLLVLVWYLSVLMQASVISSI